MELIFGGVVSLLVQWLKTEMQTKEYQTLGLVLVLSLGAAALYTWLYSVGLWESVLEIVVVAGAIYAYIWQRFEK